MCYVLYMLWSLKADSDSEVTSRRLIEAKEKNSFGQAASVMIHRVGERSFIISASPDGAELVFLFSCCVIKAFVLCHTRGLICKHLVCINRGGEDGLAVFYPDGLFLESADASLQPAR